MCASGRILPRPRTGRRHRNRPSPCQFRRIGLIRRYPEYSGEGMMTKGRKPRMAAAKASNGSAMRQPDRHTFSPLAPKSFPKLPPLAGVRLAVAEAGIRYKGRPDLLLATFATGT